MADRSLQTLASPDRPVQQCREIFLRQLGCAIEELEGSKPNVHGARKQLKRARATLRLLRPAIGDELYSHENIAARDAARPLSKARDEEVMNDALDGLLERFGAAASGLQVAPLRQSLHKGRPRVRRMSCRPSKLTEIKSRPQAIHDALASLAARRRRLGLHRARTARYISPRAARAA